MDNKFIRVVVLLDGQPVVETTEGSSVVIDGEEVPVTLEAVTHECINNKVIKVTVVADKDHSVATRKRKYCKRKNRKRPRFGRTIKKPRHMKHVTSKQSLISSSIMTNLTIKILYPPSLQKVIECIILNAAYPEARSKLRA